MPTHTFGCEFFIGQAGEPQSHTAIATDPGADDLTFNWTHGTNETYPNNGTFPFEVRDTTSISFDNPGVYEVAVTVADDDGGSTTDAVPKVVVGAGGERKSIGFWRQQYSDRGQKHYTEADRVAFLKITNLTSEEFQVTNQSAAHDNLSAGGGDLRENARAQALAAWLNFASGRIEWNETIDIDGDGEGDRSFHDVMTEVEAILSNSETSQEELERAKDLAEAVNDP